MLNMAARARRINMGILLTNRKLPTIPLNKCQEIGQKPSHLATPKKVKSAENAQIVQYFMSTWSRRSYKT